MPDSPSNLPGIELAPGVWTDRDQLRFSFSRSSGPGGQNVNKLNTKAELRVAPAALHGLKPRALDRLLTQAANRLTGEGDFLLTSDTERTQEANRQSCLRKLRELIVQAQIEPKVRRKTKPSRAAKRRRVESKRKRGEVKRLRGKVE